MWTLSAISVLVGIASGFALGAMTVYTYDIVPDHARGRLQALRRTLGEVGGLGGPVIAGAVATVTGPGATFLVFAPLHLISAVLLAFVAVETAAERRRTRSSAGHSPIAVAAIVAIPMPRSR